MLPVRRPSLLNLRAHPGHLVASSLPPIAHPARANHPSVRLSQQQVSIKAQASHTGTHIINRQSRLFPPSTPYLNHLPHAPYRIQSSPILALLHRCIAASHNIRCAFYRVRISTSFLSFADEATRPLTSFHHVDRLWQLQPLLSRHRRQALNTPNMQSLQSITIARR